MRITCACWVVVRLLSYKVWLVEDRTYPIIPAISGFDEPTSALHAVPYYLSMVCLLILLIKPRQTAAMVVLLCAALFSAMLDIIVWQPWEYQFIFTLVVFIINRERPGMIVNAMIFLLASTYIYSGLCKINGGFLYSVWDNMLLRNFLKLPPEQVANPYIHYSGLGVPLYETSAGLALLLFRKNRWAAMAIISMHILVCIGLSDIGIGYNSIVIPWNISMALIVFTLFIKSSNSFSAALLLSGRNAVVFVFWGILPALSFIGYWPRSFSSNLYSGKAEYMTICLPTDNPPRPFSEYAVSTDRRNQCDGKNVQLHTWSIRELRVLPFSERWYFEKVRDKIKTSYPGHDNKYTVYSYPFKENIEL